MATKTKVVVHELNDEIKLLKPPENDSFQLLYKTPCSVIIVLGTVVAFYIALTRNDDSTESNVWTGACFAFVFYVIISMLTFPNGPFIRPHPAIWRIVFGLSVLYFLFLVSCLFHKYQDVRSLLVWFYNDLRYTRRDEKEYAVNCSDVSLMRIWESMDFFIFAHFWGWALKALLLRHYGVLWTISVMWEFSEIAFAHLLPNFNECWWDAILLDILLCNGLGIWFGMIVCRRLEMRDLHWESISDIHSTTGRIRRAVLQFTPATFSNGRWLERNSSFIRVMAVSYLIIIWNLAELNTFFLKHIFHVPPSHPLIFIRLLLLAAVSAPAIRQYYSFVTDTQCSRLGPQCWLFFVITFTESVICFKFGAEMFKNLKILHVFIWLGWQVVMSVLCLYVSIWLAQKWKTFEFDHFHVALRKRRLTPRTRSLSDTHTDTMTDRHIDIHAHKLNGLNGYHKHVINTTEVNQNHSEGLYQNGIHHKKVT